GMEQPFWPPFVASILAALVTSVGIILIRRYETWGKRNTIYFICFAAGVLISVSFLHIIPKSFTMNPHAPLYLFAGFFGMHLLNRFIHFYACHKDPDEHYSFGLLPLIGIGTHSFIDGFIYSIAFSVSLFTGTLTVIGMIFHELPEGIITYLLLLRGGFGEKKAFLLAFAAAVLTTPLGMLVSYPIVSQIDQELLGALLSLSAGALVYVGATHLLPQAEKEHARFSLLALASGIAVAIIIILSKS
ncbi:MAG: ZIP family metal transporter, partial [Campylobacterales bacterium]|nr:ZIP family metal transporter [Campylobacterales bacterium]